MGCTAFWQDQSTQSGTFHRPFAPPQNFYPTTNAATSNHGHTNSALLGKRPSREVIVHIVTACLTVCTGCRTQVGHTWHGWHGSLAAACNYLLLLLPSKHKESLTVPPGCTTTPTHRRTYISYHPPRRDDDTPTTPSTIGLVRPSFLTQHVQHT